MKIDLTNMTTLKKSRNRLKEIVSRITGLERKLERVKRRIDYEIARPMVNRLKKYPRPRRYPEEYPIHFVSDRQRKYVMANLNGKPYQRTSSIRRGWRYKLNVEDGKIVLYLNNKSKHAPYVQGLYGLGDRERHIKRYRKPIQPYHTTTGWDEAYEIVLDATKKADRIVKDELTPFNKAIVRLLR